MNRLVRWVLAIVIVGSAAGRAAAQESRPPVEVGAGIGALMTVPYEDFFTNDFASPAGDLRLSVPMSPRFSFEATGSLGRRGNQFNTRLEGLYLLQIKQRLRSATRGGFHAFLAYGLAGYWARVSQKEVRSLQPNGEYVVHPAFKYTEWEQPLATFAGGGVQYALSPHVALRTEVRLVSLVFLPMGVRVAGSVSIPIGRYSRD